MFLPNVPGATFFPESRVFDTLCVRKNTFWKQVLMCCSRASFSQISKIFWQETPTLIMSPDLLINIHSFFVG